jgi:hypothetical protein
LSRRLTDLNENGVADDPKPLNTAVPQVNFTITTAERVGALVGGVPAWAARRRRIEDLDREIRRVLAAKPGPTLPPRAQRLLESMNELIDKHNRYFPIEANLKVDPFTGRLLEGSQPWQPMRLRTADDYFNAT